MRRWVVVAIVASTGCASIFGLEEPARRSTSMVDASIDAPLDAPLDAQMCPASFIKLSGQTSEYLPASVTGTWQVALTACASEGPGIHLAVLSTTAEYAAIQSALAGREIYVGLHNMNDPSVWEWVTSETAAPLMWGQNQPNNPSLDRCGRLNAGTLYDTDCTESHAFICECDGYDMN